MSGKVMEDYNISFWWQLADGYIDAEQWDYKAKYNGGMVEGIDLIYSLGKVHNIAACVNIIANNIHEDPIKLWNKSILKIKTTE